MQIQVHCCLESEKGVIVIIMLCFSLSAGSPNATNRFSGCALLEPFQCHVEESKGIGINFFIRRVGSRILIEQVKLTGHWRLSGPMTPTAEAPQLAHKIRNSGLGPTVLRGFACKAGHKPCVLLRIACPGTRSCLPTATFRSVVSAPLIVEFSVSRLKSSASFVSPSSSNRPE
ncbi:hypothetical protein ACVWW4_003800 [Bradyrhizobium sp. LB7.1]